MHVRIFCLSISKSLELEQALMEPKLALMSELVPASNTDGQRNLKL